MKTRLMPAWWRFGFQAVGDALSICSWSRLLPCAWLLATPGIGAEQHSSGVPAPASPEVAGTWPARARLEDDSGKPIVGAIIRCGPVTVESDDSGGFRCEGPATADRVRVVIEAAGFAPSVQWLPRSTEVATIKLGVGAVVTGRLVKDGQPVPEVKLVLHEDDRVWQGYRDPNNWRFEAVTDHEGGFRFERLPVNAPWRFHGVIDSLGRRGALPSRSVHTSSHGTVLELGDVALEDPLTLAGRLVPADGYHLSGEASQLRLWIGGIDPGNEVVASAEVKADGSFRFEGLYPGMVTMHFRGLPFGPTPWNRSFDQWNPGSLVGLLSNSNTNLLIEVGPGPFLPDLNYDAAGLPAGDQPRGRELGGIEAAMSGIRVSGIVLDDRTGEPLDQFELVPGRQPPLGARPPQPFIQKLASWFRDVVTPANELPYWQTSRRLRGWAGKFDLRFELLASTPLLKIAAPGYEPMVVGPITTSTNGLVVRLPVAATVGGIIFDSVGQPVPGAKVLYGVDHESFGLRYTGELMEWGNLEARAITDAEGRFTIPRRLNGRRLFASHAAGWAIRDGPDLNSGMRIHLEPWAVVTGRLITTNGSPVANAGLSVDFWGDLTISGHPSVTIKSSATTGSDGRFWLTNVPPAELRLYRGAVVQTWFHAAPGTTNDLGDVILDTPPPEPLLRRLKQKVGL